MIEVLYLDDNFCVVNKPSGSVVHRTRGAESFPIVLQLLRDQLGKKVFPVHRLDRGTSGCLVFAFDSETTALLQTALKEGRKKYTALCLGCPPLEGVFDRELTAENKVKKEAMTKFKRVGTFENYSLLELDLITGRKHQIRRHLSFEGHHIVGDVNYGKGWLNRKFREDHDFNRLFLHCHEISFAHPETGKQIHIESALSLELETLLKSLAPLEL
ncbi:MAG: RluA family pseudouridine synthase [Bdellovibrionales bacterium]